MILGYRFTLTKIDRDTNLLGLIQGESISSDRLVISRGSTKISTTNLYDIGVNDCVEVSSDVVKFITYPIRKIIDRSDNRIIFRTNYDTFEIIREEIDTESFHAIMRYEQRRDI